MLYAAERPEQSLEFLEADQAWKKSVNILISS